MKIVRIVFMMMLLIYIGMGCVSKKQYVQVQDKLNDTTKLLENCNQNSNKLSEEKDNCQRELTDYKNLYQQTESQNASLRSENEALKLDVGKRESIIEMQKKVIGKLDDTKKNIEEQLTEQIKAQEIKLTEMEGKLKVTFVDKILFNTGQANLNEKGKEILLKIGNSLKGDAQQNIVIEGHTDNVPIGADLLKKYPTNWELSTARAVAVVRFLIDKAGIQPERLTASGFSYFKPVAPNDTPEGRRQNRRIEIVLSAAH